MNQIWQLWSESLSQSFIDSVIETGQKYPVGYAGLGFGGETANDNYRSSEIRWVDAGAEGAISSTILAYAHTANRNAFGFDINYISDIQYTTYYGDKQGKYDWHEDIFWDCPRPFHRKVTFVAQLSDPSEYEGGHLELDPQHPAPDPALLHKKGSVIVFPSFIKHRVTPVTAGIRRSLVAWIEGPKFR